MQATIQIANRKQRDIFGKQIILAITYFYRFQDNQEGNMSDLWCSVILK